MRPQSFVTSLAVARFAWILWTGTASALESAAYGNVGPAGSWEKGETFADLTTCDAARAKQVDAFLQAHPAAVKRDKGMIFEKKALPGDEDEEMIVHTVTRFLCIPDSVEPPAQLGGPPTVHGKSDAGAPPSQP